MQLHSSSSVAKCVRVGIPQKFAARPGRISVHCQAQQDTSSRRQLLGLGGLLLAATVVAPAAQADLIDDLKAKSEANKALNDRKRLATSYANFARSRTLDDGTCQFPKNFFGCDIPATAGNVKFITEDAEIECQGNQPGTCPEVPNMFKVGP